MSELSHAVLLGASRGCGYHALRRLLTADSTWTATILLRKPAVIEQDEYFKGYIASGRLEIVQGDATRYEDVKKLFPAADGAEGGGKRVDVVITSVGGVPHFTLRGFVNDQPTLCTDATIALLQILQELSYTPRVVAVSTMGLGDDHANLPYLIQWLYTLLLGQPHEDKSGLEYLLRRASSVLSTSVTHIPPEEILSQKTVTTLKADYLPDLIIVRPALLMGDGSATEQPKGASATKVGEGLTVWTVNRAEVGRVVVEECIMGDKWVNKSPTVGW